MKYAIVVAAFLLGMAFGPTRAKAGMNGLAYVTEVTEGPETINGNVVGFSCAYDGKSKQHCFIVSQ